MRAEFEKWLAEYRKGKPYWSSAREEILWDGWKASRAAALEDAAKVCDAREDWYDLDACRGQACAAAGCANDIRALAKGEN